jgi:hypothetical protein
VVREDSLPGNSIGLWPESPPSDGHPVQRHDLTAPALLERRSFGAAREGEDWPRD